MKSWKSLRSTACGSGAARALSCGRAAGGWGAARGAVWLVMVGVWTGGTGIGLGVVAGAVVVAEPSGVAPMPVSCARTAADSATLAMSAAAWAQQRPVLPTFTSPEGKRFLLQRHFDRRRELVWDCCYDEPAQIIAAQSAGCS